MVNVYYEDNRFIEDVLRAKEYAEIFRFPVVIDVGANIGTFSVFIHDFADEIYAIEPAKENLAVFHKTIKKNRLTKIKTYEEVIACNTGFRNIRMNGSHAGGGWTITDYTGPEASYRQVNSITMRGFMEREEIGYADLIKIDAEGAEREIFLDQTFPFEKIRIIVGELHNESLNKEVMGNIKQRFWDNGFNFDKFAKQHFIAKRT